MAIYEMICPTCKKESEIICSMSEYSKKIKTAKCDICKNTTLDRHIRTPTSMSIPANMTYNNQVKVVGSTTKDQASVPINIIDELPDGTTKVTRIGKKADIENE